MESHPGKVSAEPVPTIEIARIELKERSSKLVIGKPLDVNLRWDQDKYPKNERNEQAFESFAKILASTPEVQGKS